MYSLCGVVDAEGLGDVRHEIGHSRRGVGDRIGQEYGVRFRVRRVETATERVTQAVMQTGYAGPERGARK